MSDSLLDEVDRLLAESEDADDVLRVTVLALVASPGIVWAGIGLVEGREVTLGPVSGTPDEARRACAEVVFEGTVVGEIWADGEIDSAGLEDIARRIAPQVLIGWDTGGTAWEP